MQYGLSLSGPELEHELKSAGAQYHIPVPVGSDSRPAREFVETLFSMDRVEFTISRNSQSGWFSIFPTHRIFDAEQGRRSLLIQISPNRQTWSTVSEAGEDSLPHFLGNLLATKTMYGFRAERMNIGQCQITESPNLLPDASNLPSVLLQLPHQQAVHEKYQAFVRQIFPSVDWVGARPVSANIAAVEITMRDSNAGENRAGIAVPLSESGTGIGQVLALLYVAVTARHPRIMMIDEPNSFLHPGAAKKLLSILQGFGHQYIVSTHSADLIRVVDPEFLHLVEWDNTQSRITTLNHENIEDQRRLLGDIGVSLSDVFGSDGILWVEGPTEEKCFPLLLDHLGLASPAVSIVSVVATDDLTGRRPRAKLAWEVYEKLSTGSALVPPALSFVFDQEGRSREEIVDMQRQSRGRIKFLPRRTYENYLIDNDAISSLLTTAIAEPVNAEDVGRWIEAHREERAYLDQTLVDGVEWRRVVDAPKLLHDLFNALSAARVEYQKTRHSIALTEWLVANKPETMGELMDFVRSLVPASDR